MWLSNVFKTLALLGLGLWMCTSVLPAHAGTKLHIDPHCEHLRNSRDTDKFTTVFCGTCVKNMAKRAEERSRKHKDE